MNLRQPAWQLGMECSIPFVRGGAVRHEMPYALVRQALRTNSRIGRKGRVKSAAFNAELLAAYE
jgi:hypothetical protein